MKAKTFVIAALLLASPLAFAQASTEPVESTLVITGEVLRYEPGKVLVVRSGGKEISYTINPTIVMPSDVQVGKTVTVHTEPGPTGATIVSRVTTTSITPDGQTKRTTEETTTKPTGETSKTTTVTVQGSVRSYTPGKSITVLRSDGSTKTFTISQGAKLPAEIQTGKSVTILTLPDGSVQTITIEKE